MIVVEAAFEVILEQMRLGDGLIYSSASLFSMSELSALSPLCFLLGSHKDRQRKHHPMPISWLTMRRPDRSD